MANTKLEVLADAQTNKYLKYTPSGDTVCIELTKWTCDIFYDVLRVKDIYGQEVVNEKISATNPIETQNATRTSASDVRADINELVTLS